jgi:hypothetical protein
MKFCFGLALALMGSFALSAFAETQSPIDRHAVVVRHNPTLRQFDSTNPFSVGNGQFAFTADCTGLQTFANAFTNTTPLGTLSQWGWHSFPNPNGWSNAKFHHKEFNVFGRMVPYNDVPHNIQTPEIRWLRRNPHRLDLGQIGLVLLRRDGSRAESDDLSKIEQTLDLWNGILHSRFQFDGQTVEVQTLCHPERDLLAVRIASSLLQSGRLKVQIHFPYGTGAPVTADWTQPEAHETTLERTGEHTALFHRKLDNDSYEVSASWNSGGQLSKLAKHQFVIANTNYSELEIALEFTPKLNRETLPAPRRER